MSDTHEEATPFVGDITTHWCPHCLKTTLNKAPIWGGDPEQLIAAWEQDRAELKARANELAADLDHAERDNRRLAAEVKRLKGEK